MGMDVLLFLTATPMKENTNLINDMALKYIDGMMEEFMMVSFRKTSVMEKVCLPGLMAQFMMGTSSTDNDKDMVKICLPLGDRGQYEGSWKDGRYDGFGTVPGKMVDDIAGNGEME